LSSQPAVLQVVILRDGLLVGTEVFVPGSYTLGSAADADLRLDDAAVDAAHAVLYFQNGKAAVQDSGSTGGLYVNGHQVTACEIRAVDEVVVGPFVLKARVLGNKPAAKATPPPELSALLGGTASPGGGVPRVAPLQSPPRRSHSTPPPPPAEAYAGQPAPEAPNGKISTDTPAPGTMPSARRRKTSTKSRLKPVAEAELATTLPYPSRPANAKDSGATCGGATSRRSSRTRSPSASVGASAGAAGFDAGTGAPRAAAGGPHQGWASADVHHSEQGWPGASPHLLRALLGRGPPGRQQLRPDEEGQAGHRGAAR